MAARIKVVSGPDEGLQVVFGVAEVRIGRGAGFNVPLTDDGLNGQLRVWFEKGTYVVRNELQNPGYFLPPEGSEGYEEFHPREQRVWFHGNRVQPTQSTVLELTIEDGVKIPDGKIEITKGTDSAAAKKSRDSINLIVSIVLIVAAAALFLIDPGPADPATSGASRVTYKMVDDALTEEAESKDVRRDPVAVQTVRAVQHFIREGRFLEVYNRPEQAYRQYEGARDELNRALGAPESGTGPSKRLPESTVSALDNTRVYVNDRLVRLAAVVRAKKAGGLGP